MQSVGSDMMQMHDGETLEKSKFGSIISARHRKERSHLGHDLLDTRQNGSLMVIIQDNPS